MNKKSLFIFILIGMIVGGLIGRFVLSAFGIGIGFNQNVGSLDLIDTAINNASASIEYITLLATSDSAMSQGFFTVI